MLKSYSEAFCSVPAVHARINEEAKDDKHALALHNIYTSHHIDGLVPSRLDFWERKYPGQTFSGEPDDFMKVRLFELICLHHLYPEDFPTQLSQ